MVIVYLLFGGLIAWLAIRMLSSSSHEMDEHAQTEDEELDFKRKELSQGDMCPHCGLIIMLPSDIEPKCLGCGEMINR